jgi:cation-transporting ATPase E
VRPVSAEQLVVDDIVMLTEGDQVVADGMLVSATGARLDESILTGESEPARRTEGEDVWAGAFVVEGVAAYRVTAAGAASFAAQITGRLPFSVTIAAW